MLRRARAHTLRAPKNGLKGIKHTQRVRAAANTCLNYVKICLKQRLLCVCVDFITDKVAKRRGGEGCRSLLDFNRC